MLKIAGWLLGTLVVLLIVFVAAERIAAESGEVVVLHAAGADGNIVDTRLWVVDHDGSQWLRVGADGSGWYTRLKAAERIELTRGPVRARYNAHPEPAQSAAVNALMQAKYGWAERFIASFVGGREGSVPIRLVPVALGDGSAR